MKIYLKILCRSRIPHSHHTVQYIVSQYILEGWNTHFHRARIHDSLCSVTLLRTKCDGIQRNKMYQLVGPMAQSDSEKKKSYDFNNYRNKKYIKLYKNMLKNLMQKSNTPFSSTLYSTQCPSAMSCIDGTCLALIATYDRRTKREAV